MSFNVGDRVKINNSTGLSGLPSTTQNAIKNNIGIITKQTNDGFAIWFGNFDDDFDASCTPAPWFLSDLMIHVWFAEMVAFDLVQTQVSYNRFINVGSF